MSKGKGGRLQLLTSLFGADGLNSRNARLVDDYLKTAGVSPRTAFVAEQVATNGSVQAALDAADAAGMGGEYKVLAEVAGGFDAMPTPRAAADAPRDPSFEQRLATDPAIQARIGEISPGFQSRMGRGEVTADEVMEVLGFGPLNPRPTPPLPDGMPRMPAPDTPSPLGERVARQRDLAGRLGSDAPPPQYTPADIGPGIPAGPPPRGFPVPFAEPRGLVPQGPRGLVPQERGLIPQRRDLSVPGESLGDAPLRLEGPEQLRLEGPRQPRLEGPDQLRIEGPRRARIEGPGVSAERNAMDDLATAVDADAARRRVPRDGDFRLDAPQRSNRARNAAMAAAAAGGGVAAFKLGTDLMFPGDSSLGSADMEPEPYRPVPNVMRPPRTTADLAAEQNPPPSVMTQEPEVVDYSAMARDKIRQANEIQRREGRVTPESAGLTREADALYRRSADERSAGRGQPIMPSEQANAQTSAVRAEGQRQIRDNPGSDPRSQARNLLGRINAGEFGDGPQRQAAVNEANRLFAMADNQRYGR